MWGEKDEEIEFLHRAVLGPEEPPQPGNISPKWHFSLTERDFVTDQSTHDQRLLIVRDRSRFHGAFCRCGADRDGGGAGADGLGHIVGDSGDLLLDFKADEVILEDLGAAPM